MAQWLANPTRKPDWDPSLLWLWCRLAATILIGPLAYEPLYAALWCSGIGGVSAAPGCRFDPCLAQCVKGSGIVTAAE